MSASPAARPGSVGSFGEFFRFELLYQLRSPLLWIISALFAIFAGIVISEGGAALGSVGNVNHNAPSSIALAMAIFTFLGMLVVVVFIASGALRDHELGTAELFFSSPMRKRDYLFGRFAGGSLAALVVFVAVALGILVAQFLPTADAERMGPVSAWPYVWSFGVIVLPNLLFIGALLLLLATTTRSMLAVYIGVIGVFVLQQVSVVLTREVDNIWFGVLIDPFGMRALSRATRYWSALERNTQLPELAGYILANRALWMSVAVAMLGAAYALFKPIRTGSASGKATADPALAVTSSGALAGRRAVVAQRFGGAATRAMLWRQTKSDTLLVLKGVAFLAMLAFGLFNLLAGLNQADVLFGTKVYPVTSLMLEMIGDRYSFLLVIIVAFYAGELVFRERAAGMDQVTDAMPMPDWVPLLAKLGALMGVIAVYLAIGAAVAIAYQLARGFTAIEPLLYAKGLLVHGIVFVLMAVVALVVHVYTNDKFKGYAAFLVVLLWEIGLGMLDVEHNMLSYGGAPDAPYSDMNGYGHFLKGQLWFQLYWGFFAALLVGLAAAFWVRGTDPARATRVRHARARLGGRLGTLCAVFALGFVATGAFVFYNTNVVNPHVSSEEQRDRQARYEKEYAQYRDLPQPRIRKVSADVDIYPERLAVDVRGRYTLDNPHSTPITDLHVIVTDGDSDITFEFAPHELVKHDEDLGYRIFRLKEPLAPGATMDFAFTAKVARRGFGNSRGKTEIVGNGTFFNNADVMPMFGYDERFQLMDRTERRDRDLGDVPRMAKLEDEAARAHHYLGDDAAWIDFETTVSTSADQIALAPGYLQREWTQDGRRYFHYKMDRPMLPFFAYLSARWQVARGMWRDIPIEVYYDAKHPMNTARMIEGAQDSLEYFSKEFSPYQHKQVRILEFPRYNRFAQAFANTIPFSESIGFIADLRDPDAIDYVYYVTAHEVAHQWWAHQVIGANVQGSTMLSESLAQYSALMVMEHRYGAPKMRKFLKYELDRYLSSRSSELIEELPLERVENQPYIHYRKGSLVFYRLKDEIGEAALNRALSRFLADKAFQEPPFTTSRELLAYIRAETPPEKHELLVDLFEKITFYDNRVVEAKAVERPDGKFDVTIDVKTGKVHVDGKGVETPVALGRDDIEIGVFARAPGADEGDEKVLVLDKRRFDAETATVTLTVDEKPYDVGIDPYNKLIDRVSTDNRKRVAF